jgi:hypothetical protein
MGFYLRKSFRFGPVRFNLSKSGIGTSFGVKGARIGVNSRGQAYVNAGRGGFYFRETIPSTTPQRRGGANTPPLVDSPATAGEPIRQIESGASVGLTGAGQASFVAELNRVHKRKSRTAIVGIFGVLVTLLIGHGSTAPSRIHQIESVTRNPEQIYERLSLFTTPYIMPVSGSPPRAHHHHRTEGHTSTLEMRHSFRTCDCIASPSVQKTSPKPPL